MDHHFPFFSWRFLWEWSPNNLFLRPWRGSACVQRSFTGLIRWWKRLSALALMKKLTWPLTETHWISLDTMNKWGAKWLNGYKLAEPTVCKSTSDQLKTIVSICLYHEFLSTNSRQTHRAPEDDLGILGHELLPVAGVDAWAAADAHGQVGKDEKIIPTTVSIDCSKGLSWTYMFLHVLPPTMANTAVPAYVGSIQHPVLENTCSSWDLKISRPPTGLGLCRHPPICNLRWLES